MTQGKKLSRREREKLRQRQEILDAALELFSESGYHNVSMNEIAEKSEFAVGTLYKFFSSKEDIYKSLMVENSNRFFSALMDALKHGGDEIEKLRNLVRAKGEVFMQNASVVRLYHAETRGAGYNVKAGLDAEIRKKYDQVQLAVAAVFQRGIKKKLFNKIADPFHLAVVLNSIINDFLFLWLEDSEKNPFPENPDVILNILFNGLLNESPKA
jgi:TetR/AcrR family transcriptional regulator